MTPFRNTGVGQRQSTSPSRTSLNPGSLGREVLRLQEHLKKLGYPVVTDAYFGDKTVEAVKSFQADHGLNPDGLVTPETWEALEKKLKEKGTMTITSAPVSQSKTWQWLHTLSIVFILLAITLVGWFSQPAFRLGSWFISLALIALLIILAGHGITGLGRGWLIDDRYMMSLSRLQAVLWTVVILSAFFIAVLGNLKLGDPHPLEIAIPTEIWLVMGISATSLVASPLIRGNKKKKEPDPREKARTFRMIAKERGTTASTETANQGQIIVNLSPEDASLSDLFRGEETGNGALLDLGKIQLFLFTLLIVLVYVSALSALFTAGTAIHDFPVLDESTIALLGISHTAYLANKAIPHSETSTT